MFSSIVALFHTAARFVVEGFKKIFGEPTEPDATVIATKAVSVVVAVLAVAVHALPVINARSWSDTLFRVSYQLWSNQLPLGKAA